MPAVGYGHGAWPMLAKAQPTVDKSTDSDFSAHSRFHLHLSTYSGFFVAAQRGSTGLWQIDATGLHGHLSLFLYCDVRLPHHLFHCDWGSFWYRDVAVNGVVGFQSCAHRNVQPERQKMQS